MDVKPFDKKVWLSSPTMHGEEMVYVKEAYETNWMSTVGENLNKLEQSVAKKVGVGYAVALSAGTAALHLAVKLAGVKPGDKVFCSDMTFAATVNPVVYEGGIPVFVDVEYDTWNMDPKALEKAFERYPDVKVIVVVHLYGTPCKMDEIREIAEKQGFLNAKKRDSQDICFIPDGDYPAFLQHYTGKAYAGIYRHFFSSRIFASHKATAT